jgi:UDP-2,3-diacylglucosamine hydrolase
MQRPAHIASDVHLGAVPQSTERAFLRYLDFVGGDASSLLIAGDLFDFWFEYRRVIPGRHFRVLAALSELVDAGIPVTLAGGNHDAWGGRFLREEVGLVFHAAPFAMQLAGRMALVAHGDGLGSGDLRYRALKTLIRSPVTIAVFRMLHPDLGLRIAQAVSRTEQRPGHQQKLEGRARFIENWARARLLEKPELSYVICGHAHMPVVRPVETGRYYLNAGDWISNFTYITVSAEGLPELQHWAPA